MPCQKERINYIVWLLGSGRINVIPDMMAKRIARAALRRMGEASEIANATLFLASDEVLRPKLQRRA